MVEAGIVGPSRANPPAYRFRHQLLGDLAYDTQLQPARRRAHAAIADALRSGARSAGRRAAVVADHLEQAGADAEAVEVLMEAAEEALALGAYAEVASLVARALDLVPAAPADRQADLEFRVRLLRGTSVSSTLGFAAPDAIVDFEACQELAARFSVEGYIDELAPDEAIRALRPRVHRDRGSGPTSSSRATSTSPRRSTPTSSPGSARAGWPTASSPPPAVPSPASSGGTTSGRARCSRT